jgi:hypothetical protein
MKQMSEVTDFIKAAVADKPSDAESAFDAIMQPKIADARETASVDFKKQIFNNTEPEDEG